MTLQNKFTEEILDFDKEKEVNKICTTMRTIMGTKLRRRGAVIAVSGGIDSSVCAALAVKAYGKNKVLALQLPEVDSAENTQSRSTLLIEHLSVKSVHQNIENILETIGCYSQRDKAIQEVFPEFNNDWKSKIAIAGGMEGRFNHFNLVVKDPTGNIHEKRLSLKPYLQIVAATNYKQRIRKTIEYFHADRLNYAVIGTPNRLEFDQGFFVKNGDGSSDLKPIAHLYKTQVYALAEHLGLPEVICHAEPTTDTYSLAQGQDEFYFALPYQEMDKALWAHNYGASLDEISLLLSIPIEQAMLVVQDIKTKRTTTAYLHAKAYLMEKVCW
jgi:NAD+ synthase